MYGGEIDVPYLLTRSWQMLRADGAVICSSLRFLADGQINGHMHDNEHRWGVVADNVAFFNKDGQVTTLFDELTAGNQSDRRWRLRGKLRNTDIYLVLREVDNLQERLDGLATSIVESIDKEVLGRNFDSYDIIRMAHLQATFESAKYYTLRMRTARAFEHKNDLLKHALGLRTFPGLCLEFGVATGSTVNIIAGEVQDKVYGFDVFTGLPETWRTGFDVGRFAQELPTVAANVELVVGLFGESLPPFVQAHPEPVAFLYVDCDLYSSAKVIFDILDRQIKSGTIIVFDEYMNYPGWKFDEHKAFQEFVARRQLRYAYESIIPNHQQVCVRIL